MSRDDVRWCMPTLPGKGYPGWLRESMKRDPSFQLAYDIQQRALHAQSREEFDEATRAQERVMLLAEHDRYLLAMEGRSWGMGKDSTQTWREGQEPADLDGLEQQDMSYALALRLMMTYKEWGKVPGLERDEKHVAKTYFRAARYVAARAEAQRATAHASGMRWTHMPLPTKFDYLEKGYGSKGIVVMP